MSNILKVAIALVFLASVLPGIAVAFDDGRPLRSLDETTTVSYTADYQVSATGLYSPEIYDNETVLNEDAGAAELVEGTDYEFYPTNGTLRFFNTANTSDGDTARIRYNATAPTQEHQYITTVLVVVSIGVAFMVLMVAFSFTMESVGVWGDSE